MIRRRFESCKTTRQRILGDDDWQSSSSYCSDNDDNKYDYSDEEEDHDDKGAHKYNVDLCLTVKGNGSDPPSLPLKGEHLTLGVEAIYKSKGVGDLAVFQETIRKSLSPRYCAPSSTRKNTENDAPSSQPPTATVLSYDDYKRHSDQQSSF